MHKLKELLKKRIPESLLLQYHKAVAQAAALWYRYPSKDLIVFGVTGTNGKSTTANMIAHILESAGEKVGLMTTVNYQIADKKWINSTRMTMLGRFQLQKMLRDMVRAGCRYVVIETSSEGIKQFRHIGIQYDIAVFTNLTPEHIEAHGSFEKYKEAKGELFKALSKYPNKYIHGQRVETAAVINVDDAHAGYYASFAADQKYGFGLAHNPDFNFPQYIGAVENLEVTRTTFSINGTSISMDLVGKVNVLNALAAYAAVQHVGISLEQTKKGLESMKRVPGRMELIEAGQPFTVLVDYAHDYHAFEELFSTLRMFDKNRIIHVFGSAGGVRDHAKRPALGAFSAEHADISVITDEDSYDEPIEKVISEIAVGAKGKGKIEGEDLFLVQSRAEGILKACKLARPGDMVLITGKGTEQSIKSYADYGKAMPWDDRVAAYDALKKLGYEK